MPEPPFDDPDPQTLRQIQDIATRCIRFHLQGLPKEWIEEGVQQVSIAVLVFHRRHGPPRNLEALVVVTARRRASSLLREWRRNRRHDDIDDFTERLPDDWDLDWQALDEETAILVQRILAFFREHHSECLPLAIARTEGENFRKLAERLQVKQAALLQRWSRCIRRLKAAAQRGAIDLLGRRFNSRGRKDGGAS